MTWRPQPWQDGDWGGEEPLSDSDSEEEDFPDESTTPLGNYILHGEAEIMKRVPLLCDILTRLLLSFRTETAPGCSAAV